jgi:glutamate synthase domain-containing protein 3
MSATATRTEIDGQGLDTRAINRQIREAIDGGSRDIVVHNPGAKHSLGVGILHRVKLTFEGSLGYFGVGLGDGIEAHIKGRVGWSLAENLMDGEVVVEKSAGSSTGAAIRGGTVVVKGNVGGRTGITQKGGTILVGGDCGFLAGFMMHKGRIVVCGDIGRAAGDSMYDGEIFVAGKVASLGIDTMLKDLDELDDLWLREHLDRYGLENPGSWRKIVAGRKLYNYDNLEPLERKIAL